MIASLEVDADDGVWVEAEVDGQNLQTHIIVVHLVVAKRHIDVDRMEVFILDQELLVDLGGLLEVRAQVVQSRHAQLILNRTGQPCVQVHDFVLISQLLGQLEEKAHL